MKSKTTKTATLVLIVFTLFNLVSCGPKRPGTQAVENFMESIIFRIDQTKHAYDQIVIVIPEEQNVIAGTMLKTTHGVMEKQMTNERKLIDECKTFEADELAKQKSEALKKAGIEVIDTYISGLKNEMTEIENLVSHGKTKNSPEVITLIDKFDERLRAKYEAFGKIQSELAKEFGITLY